MAVVLEEIKNQMREIRTILDVAVAEVDFYERTANFEIRSPSIAEFALPKKVVTFNATTRDALREQFRNHIQKAIDDLITVKELIP